MKHSVYKCNIKLIFHFLFIMLYIITHRYIKKEFRVKDDKTFKLNELKIFKIYPNYS